MSEFSAKELEVISDALEVHYNEQAKVAMAHDDAMPGWSTRTGFRKKLDGIMSLRIRTIGMAEEQRCSVK